MDGRRRPTADPLTVVAAAGTTAVLGALLWMLVRGRPADAFYDLYLLINAPTAIALLWMSRMVLRRRPRHATGLVLLAVGIVGGAHAVVSATVDARLVAAGMEEPLSHLTDVVPADLPLDAALPLWVMAWLWVPAPVLMLVALPLVFPEGRLDPGPARVIAATGAVGAALLVAAFAVDAWPGATWTSDDAPAVVPALVAPGALAVLGAAVAALATLLRRWGTTPATQRGPFRAVAAAAAVFAVVATTTYPWQTVWTAGVAVTFNALVVVHALAVARYRLHDVEPVLGRTAVSAAVAVAVAVAFLALVAAAGVVLGVGEIAVLLVVGLLALGADVARRRLQRAADRALYRRRADRTEVLSRLARGAGPAATVQDVLAEVAELLVRSSGARRAEVRLDDAAGATVAGAHGGAGPEPVLTATVAHGTERFGELRLYARAAADLAPDATQLTDDVAHALGLILRDERLTRQLHDQLDELRASRRRLVEAQDHARRSLERDIHDGAQARLVALRLRLATLRVKAADDGLAGDLDAIDEAVDAAIRTLRDLARGLHPPILEQAGPAEALRTYAAGLPVQVTVRAERVGRHPRAVEGAVYFTCLEAVQNAIRHGGAQEIEVGLARADGGGVRCWVRDDGAGFDPARAHRGTGLANIADRASALGGRLWIDAAPGRGTRLEVQLPGSA